MAYRHVVKSLPSGAAHCLTSDGIRVILGWVPEEA